MTLMLPRVTRRGGVVPAFLVDDCHAVEVAKHCWSWTGKYFMSNAGESGKDGRGYSRKRYISLHQFIWQLAGKDKCDELDHANLDPTDNRLCNLRPADRRLNGSNRRFKPKPNGLPQGVYKGGPKTWRARIVVNKKACHIGTYGSVEEASAAYQEIRSLIIKHRAAKIAERVGEA